ASHGGAAVALVLARRQSGDCVDERGAQDRESFGLYTARRDNRVAHARVTVVRQEMARARREVFGEHVLEFVVFVRSNAQVDDGLAQPRRGELLAREDPDRSDASILSSGGTRRVSRKWSLAHSRNCWTDPVTDVQV